jgi:hypothetical protein
VTPRRSFAALAFAAALTAGGFDARADAAADLEKAHDAYVARQYSDAEVSLRVLLDPRVGALKDPENIAEARMYLGAVFVAEGKKDDAAKTFDTLLDEKPDYEPDGFRVTKEALDAFRDEQTRHRTQIAAALAEKVKREQAEKAKAEAVHLKELAHIKWLETVAGEETVVEHNSRWKALLPFGVGQFQNGQTNLGWVFLLGESVFAVGSIVGAAASVYNSNQANQALEGSQPAAAPVYNSRALTWAIAGDTLFGLFALTAAGGILHAELTFVPERITIRKREIPEPAQLTLSPLIGPTGLGLRGTF